MDGHTRNLVDAFWADTLGVDIALLRTGGVHVVTAELGLNDAMSFRFGESCIIAVRSDRVDEAVAIFSDRDPDRAFTSAALTMLVGTDGRVDGPSLHAYADENSFQGRSDDRARPVLGSDPDLRAFLHEAGPDEWAESGFPPDPPAADPASTQFWLLRDEGSVVAAGNMTEWRRRPADVGVLTAPSRRGQGLATRLAGAMVTAALPSVGVARYRALATNSASLAVARRLGFEPYGQNYRARRAVRDD